MKSVFKISIVISSILLFLTILLCLPSGFGITDHRIVQPMTLGLLGKANFLKIHEILWITFVILLAFHIAAYVFVSLRFFEKKVERKPNPSKSRVFLLVQEPEGIIRV